MPFYIDSYSFGSIIVNGQSYNRDMILLLDRVVHPWWRKEGHVLRIEDLHDIEWGRPGFVIIGSGAYGMMAILPETVKYIEEQGNCPVIKQTVDAVKIYNRHAQQGDVVIGCFHLTC